MARAITSCLLMMTYHHGLRVSEAVGLRRDELDLDRARLWVRRLKSGLSVEQSIAGDDRRLQLPASCRLIPRFSLPVHLSRGRVGPKDSTRP